MYVVLLYVTFYIVNFINCLLYCIMANKKIKEILFTKTKFYFCFYWTFPMIFTTFPDMASCIGIIYIYNVTFDVRFI